MTRLGAAGRISQVSTRPATALLAAAAATLLTVQITTAQSQIRDLDALGPAHLITHILHGGGLRAGDEGLTRDPSTADEAAASTDDDASAPGAVLSPSAGLTINAVFDSTITSDPNAAAIENAIDTAIANIQSMFSDPITVTINFSEMNSGLGESSAYYYNLSYSTFLAALKADSTTSNDATATALLPSVSTNPVNGNSTINVKTANLRAVGISGAVPPAGQPDGFITVNTSITSPGSPGTTGMYYLIPVVEHEMDEVLGLGSSLPSVLSNTIFPEDLFRYDQNGARTFTTTSSVQAFFSIDDRTALAQLDNQNDGGDFGDWQSNPLPSGVLPKVQDAFATPGADPALGVELTVLDVIGYNRVGAGVAPSITLQPVNQTVTARQNPQFTIAASGTPAPTYQWQVSTNGGLVWSSLLNLPPYSGVTTTTLTIDDPSAALDGDLYRAVATNTAGTATSSAATLTVRPATAGDYDGSGKADIVVFRPSDGTWYLRYTDTGTTAGVQWGNGLDVPVPGDYDGDGKTDIAVFRPSNGTWYIIYSSTGTAASFQWGNANDVPVPGDYDGDGKTDIAVFRPSNGTWYIVDSSTGTPVSVQWGNGSDIPVSGDFDGDGKTDIAVFRPSNGTWYIINSSTGTATGFQWGNGLDVPVSGDFDGDGKTDIAVFRPSNGTWYIVYSSTGTAVGFQWGNGLDIPVPADYDGDGKTDIAVFRPSNGTWYIVDSSTGTAVGVQWGNGADIPMPKRP